MELEFEWDGEKADANVRKHGVAFEDSREVFFDSRRLVREDKREEYGERRFQTIGKAAGRILLVAYTHRQTRIRLISARRASLEEKELYHGRG